MFSDVQILQAIEKSSLPKSFPERFWTIDPLDGTKGFLKKKHYAVALALLERGEVVVAALGCPNLSSDLTLSEQGSLFIAVKGQGAFRSSLFSIDETPIKVSDHELAKEALFCCSAEKSHTSHDMVSRLSGKLGMSKKQLHLHGQGKYALVARGDAAAYFRKPTDSEYEEKIWDHAAGSLILEEAGGNLSDAFGKPLDFSVGHTLSNNTGILASNGHFHKDILDAFHTL